MNTSKPTASNASFFDQIADVIRPPECPSPTQKGYRYAYHLEDTITVDKIILIVSLCYHKNSTDENETHVEVIKHDDFMQWCYDTERLIESGDENDPYEISYTDFMQYNVSKIDFKEYLTSKNLVPACYEWSF